jgi:alpha-beta hydrolase superfamily lysophospholipase
VKERLKRASRRLAAYTGGALAVSLLTLFGYQAVVSLRLPDLEPWHRWAPPSEARARDLGESATLADYLAREERVFAELRAEIEERLPESARTHGNRYWRESLSHPSRFRQDWNRTYEMRPAAAPRCGALLVHGLTDSPYSMRSLARVFAEAGCLTLVLRMPGHGTTPAAMLGFEWEDWAAAVRLGMRDLAARLGPAPIFLVGYSNGGALVLDAAIDALGDPRLPRARGILLLSPMIGVASPAQLARVVGVLGALPGMAKARWESVLPEFNPFKYQSFTLRAAGETARLTRRLAARLRTVSPPGAELPPVLAFVSAVDATVSARAVIDDLFARLPANGSELVFYDVSRRSDLRPFFNVYPDALLAAARASPGRRFALTVIGNRDATTNEIAAHRHAPGASTSSVEPLGLAWPPPVFSLSHVALPFPPDDSVYGAEPDAALGDGLHLGLLAPRGERSQLTIPAEQWLRLGYNPFWADLERRVREWLDRRAGT